MSLPPPGPGQQPRLADWLAAARHRRFVGRAAELELFRAALAEGEPPFAVLYLYGPGGVGKTTLLAEYARAAAEAGVFAVLLDGRDLDPSPPAFLQALGLALGLKESASPPAALARTPRGALLIDTYEALAPLDAWLRETFLPQLPGGILVVLAGRNPPAEAWYSDAGWADLVRAVSLRNLPPEDSRAYLRARGVPATQHPAALAFTHGHPLALALVADLLAQRDDLPAFSPERAPDVVRALLDRFVRQVPGPRHRQAVEACAHARVMTEDLLAAALELEDAHELFAWLRHLSFIAQTSEGLIPHDLAREVLDADLRWRNPAAYHQLHRRLRGQIVRRLQAASGFQQQQRAFFDLLYLHRNNPLMRPYFEWKALGQAYAEPAAPGDHALILDLVRRFEGDDSASIAAHWLRRQPKGFLIFRGPGNVPLGFTASFALHEATPEDLAVDPAARAAWAYAERHGPARPGEAVMYHRFWSGVDTYQTVSPAHTLVAMTSFHSWLTTPGLAWSFVAVADAAYWHAMFSYLNLRRAPEADFAVGGHPYGVYAHDWRAEPALAWLDVMAERELATDATAEALAPAPPTPRVVLSQPDFADAVRRALRDYTRPDALAASPLLRSRLVAERAEGTPAAALQALLREAAETLRANPRDDRLYRAIHATYLSPADTQELAAERLGLPFSTYRYHLTAGIERVTTWLWRRELYGPAG